MLRRIRAFLCRLVIAALVSLPAFAAPTLLYSVTGYERLAPKRALVRESSPTAQPDLARARWRLVDEAGQMVLSGTPQPEPDTWGMRLWSLDFGAWRRPGRYRLQLDWPRPGGVDTLHSAGFDIADQLLSGKLFRSLSLRNAELRSAAAEHGGGFYDCNSLMGEARSHGAFVAGLVDAFGRRRAWLSADEQAQYRRHVRNGTQYLMQLHRGDGSFSDNHPSRRGRADDASTPFALYGLAKSLDMLDQPQDRALRDAVLAVVGQGLQALVQGHGARPVQPHLVASLAMALHRHTDSDPMARLAADAIERDLSQFDLDRRAGYAVEMVAPYFEGLALFAHAFPADPRLAHWIAQARRIALGQYLPTVAGNAFRLFPAGEPRSWRAQVQSPAAVPKGAGPAGFWASGKVARMATDAVLLAGLTGEERLLEIAAAALGWITGINSGVPSALTSQRPLGPWRNDLVAAAYIAHIADNHALPWSRWWWPGDRQGVVSVINGSTVTPEAGWAYSSARFEPSETFIWGDGLLLSAMTIFEDHFHRVRR